MTRVALVARQSSHFSRVPRVFAHALGVPYTLEVVRGLTRTAQDDYGGNPTLKIPTLRIDDATFFGAESASRRIAALAGASDRVIWPESTRTPLACNAHEITWTAMTTQAQLVMATKFHALDLAHPLAQRLAQSLDNALLWLDAHAEAAIAELPDRFLSFFEIALVCLVEHVSFRETRPLDRHARLVALVEALGAREPFVQTRFCFDA